MCFWKKNRRDSLLNGVEKIDRSFKYVRNKIKENELGERFRYRFPKFETKDQLENVFVSELDTCNDQDFAAS